MSYTTMYVQPLSSPRHGGHGSSESGGDETDVDDFIVSDHESEPGSESESEPASPA